MVSAFLAFSNQKFCCMSIKLCPLPPWSEVRPDVSVKPLIICAFATVLSVHLRRCFMRVRPSWASSPAAPEMCALLISTKGIEDINVSTCISEKRSQFTPVRWARSQRQHDRGFGKARAPPRPRTQLGQAGTRSNPAEPLV